MTKKQQPDEGLPLTEQGEADPAPDLAPGSPDSEQAPAPDAGTDLNAETVGETEEAPEPVGPADEAPEDLPAADAPTAVDAASDTEVLAPVEEPAPFEPEPHPGPGFSDQPTYPSQPPPYPQQGGQAYPDAPQPAQAASYSGPQYPAGQPSQVDPTQVIPNEVIPTQVIPTQPYQGQPGVPLYPDAPYPGQPSGPTPGQYVGQPYPGQPFPAPPVTGQPLPGQPLPSQPYPGQPYPGQPYSGQPYPGQQYVGQQAFPGGQPLAGSGYAGQPYPGQQPPVGGRPANSRSKLPLFLLIGAVAVVIVAVIAGLLLNRGAPTPIPSSSASGSTVPVPQPADPAAAVQGFLEALAHGDSATAISFAASVPSDTSLLTDAVLAAGQQQAPISEIQVSKGTGASTFDTIDATYKLGDRVVTASFDVSKAGNAWRLEQVATTVNLSSLYPDQLALTVNGAPLTTDSAMLFPGSYTVAAQDTRYGVSGGTFLVQSPQDRPDTYSMRLTLSKEGTAKIRDAAQKKLTSCLKQRSLKPAGCGFSSYLPGGNKPRTSTIRWTITKGGSAMKKLKPTVDATDPALVRATVDLQLKVNLRSTNGIRWYGYSGVYLVRGELTADGVKITLG